MSTWLQNIIALKAEVLPYTFDTLHPAAKFPATRHHPFDLGYFFFS